MDAKIDDFLNEINEIAPPKQAINDECEWKECQDELTGYSYYWNTKTDEVTWTAPPEFKKGKKQDFKHFRTSNIPNPPKEHRGIIPPSKTKIYHLNEDSGKISDAKSYKPKKYKPESDSEDEKIVLISSYGGDTESEDDENEKEQKTNNEPMLKKTKYEELPKNNNDQSDEEDDLDILARIQKRAQELKELGGELPPEVAKITNVPEINAPKSKGKTDISGFSLVAGYSDSEEEENNEVKNVLPLKPEPIPQVAHSTLFPITQPVDVSDFQPKTEETTEKQDKTAVIDLKVFQRKKRIGVALINTTKKKEVVSDDTDVRLGLGFSDSTNTEKVNFYPGFEKGGVMFLKSDVLNSPLPENETNVIENEKETEEKNIDKDKIEDMYSTLVEKLGFLNSAHPAMPPTQTMVIQAETLHVAMKDGALKWSYLQSWLSDTCTELIKLEKEATPEGWLLLWDRSHKRYYYQNRTTGISQWEYPQSDGQPCDDAMDISTTPPPEQVIRMSPPLPPTIRSPTPPPPPIISGVVDGNEKSDTLTQCPILPLNSTGQPLPPGVDLPEMTLTKCEEPEVKQDTLHSALDSFYSDIAAIENPTLGESSKHPLLLPTDDLIPTENILMDTDPNKKKKKKVKLAPGLAMKKKGVSQLVEKWKNVQQHFND